MFRKILIPIDIVDPIAEPGVYFAAQLAALSDGAVRMLHVLSDAPLRFQDFLPPRLIADRESVASSVMLELAKKANVPMGLFSQTLRTGVIYDEVLAEAKYWGLI